MPESVNWMTKQWVQQGLDALRDTLDNGNKQLKTDMVQFLMDAGFWDPKMEWSSAIARFNACMNPNKGEFFKLAELWALMKQFDRHELFLAMAEDLGYEVRRVPTEARRLAALERIADALEQANVSRETARVELEHLEALTNPSTRLDAGVQGGGLFSLPDVGMF